jgi:hypothetical protein
LVTNQDLKLDYSKDDRFDQFLTHFEKSWLSLTSPKCFLIRVNSSKVKQGLLWICSKSWNFQHMKKQLKIRQKMENNRLALSLLVKNSDHSKDFIISVKLRTASAGSGYLFQ